jgi:hypothetical protein
LNLHWAANWLPGRGFKRRFGDSASYVQFLKPRSAEPFSLGIQTTEKVSFRVWSHLVEGTAYISEG